MKLVILMIALSALSSFGDGKKFIPSNAILQNPKKVVDHDLPSIHKDILEDPKKDVHRDILPFMHKDILQDPKKGVDGDILHASICYDLRDKDMCKNNIYVKKRLCVDTCNCDNMIFKRSCKALKELGECSKNKDVNERYCKSTCGLCPCAKEVALGMQSKAIPNSRITASTIADSNHGPNVARLNLKEKAGAWCTRHNRPGEWIQVDLGKETRIQSIATQGRWNHNQWVKSYSLQYSNDGKAFKNYQRGKLFSGNFDRTTVTRHALHPAIVARYIRLIVKTWQGHICMRMELYGC